MAIVKHNLYTMGLSGTVGKKLVYKVYGDLTVVAAYPKKSTKAPTVLQKAQRFKFALAVSKTRVWLLDGFQRRFLEGLASKWTSRSAYHAGIKYFMLQDEVEERVSSALEVRSSGAQTANGVQPEGQCNYGLAKAGLVTSGDTACGEGQERPDD